MLSLSRASVAGALLIAIATPSLQGCASTLRSQRVVEDASHPDPDLAFTLGFLLPGAASVYVDQNYGAAIANSLIVAGLDLAAYKLASGISCFLGDCTSGWNAVIGIFTITPTMFFHLLSGGIANGSAREERQKVATRALGPAVESGNRFLVSKLIGFGASVNAIGDTNQPAIVIAASRGDSEIVTLLLSRNPQIEHVTKALDLALEKGHTVEAVQIIKYLGKKVSPSQLDRALRTAIKEDLPGSVERLLALGADASEASLTLAAESGAVHSVEVLLKSGATGALTAYNAALARDAKATSGLLKSYLDAQAAVEESQTKVREQAERKRRIEVAKSLAEKARREQEEAERRQREEAERRRVEAAERAQRSRIASEVKRLIRAVSAGDDPGMRKAWNWLQANSPSDIPMPPIGSLAPGDVAVVRCRVFQVFPPNGFTIDGGTAYIEGYYGGDIVDGQSLVIAVSRSGSAARLKRVDGTFMTLRRYYLQGVIHRGN